MRKTAHTFPHSAFVPDLSRDAAQRRLTQVFTAAGMTTPALDARLLLCAALRIDRLDLLRDPDRAIGADAEQIAAFAVRRLAGEPVSRILGRREFYGLDFDIGPAVLDPRSDTEVLVDIVGAAFNNQRDAPLRLLDLGIGSGAILAALLSRLPHAFGIGVDRSEAACRVARGNLATLGFAGRSAVICADWMAALAGGFNVIVSNPPYIPRAEIATLAPEVRDHDPRGALDGGVDGLDAYRSLMRPAGRLLSPGGYLAFEVGAGQADAVAALMAEAGLRRGIEGRDLGGHVRVVTAWRNG